VYLVVYAYIGVIFFTNCCIHIFSSSAASMFIKVSQSLLIQNIVPSVFINTEHH